MVVFGILNVRIGVLNLEVPSVGGKIMLKWIFKKRYGEAWIGLIWLREGAGDGLL
jgi:hypothetical protein